MKASQKELTLDEFSEFCKHERFKEFSYLTENQMWYSVADPCKQQLIFKNIKISANPAIIHLSGYGNALWFDRVRKVKHRQCMLGHVLTVYCANETEYIVVAS